MTRRKGIKDTTEWIVLRGTIECGKTGVSGVQKLCFRDMVREYVLRLYHFPVLDAPNYVFHRLAFTKGHLSVYYHLVLSARDTLPWSIFSSRADN